ncbi:hypothetical protein [Sphingorhabdus sp.]|jgi:CBS-domain-containing membrane protein|uniref:hypothetical protein n=1 Tax=Sphingorhabdus sp. TaxID=1902408 RepID=UPI0037CAAF49
MSGTMFIMLAVLIDPVRIVVGGLVGWFSKSWLIALGLAVAFGIGINFAMASISAGSGRSELLFLGPLSIAAWAALFHWIKRRRLARNARKEETK